MGLLKKALSVLLACLLIFGTVSMSPLASAATVYQLSELLQQGKIKALGRTQVGGNGINTDWSGSGFEINVNSTGGAFTVGFACNYNSYWAILVDGTQVWRGLAKSGTGTFSATVPAGQHLVSVVKETQPSSSASAYFDLTTLSFAGTVETAPAKKDLYLEFVGDSYTCGDGSLGDYVPGVKWSSIDDSATHSFPWYTSKLLNADYSFVARGGIGLLSGTSEQEATTHKVAIDEIYTKDCGYHGSNYSFVRKPDAVLLEIGANDGTSRLEEWEPKLEAMVKLIREKNGPDTHIVYMGHVPQQLQIAYDLQADLGDENFHVYHYSLGGSGSAALKSQWEGHPSYQDHEKIAQDLSVYLKNEILPQESAQKSYTDIVYYASETGDNSKDGKSAATAKNDVPKLMEQVVADNGGSQVFPNGSRLVIMLQGRVTNGTSQSVVYHSLLTTLDGKSLPILVTTYNYDGYNRATLYSQQKSVNDGNASLYANNDITFKDIIFSSETYEPNLYRPNKFYTGMNQIVFDGVSFQFTGSTPNNNAGWVVSACHFTNFGYDPAKQYYPTVTFKNGDYTNLRFVTTVNTANLWASSDANKVTDATSIHPTIIVEDGAHVGTIYGLTSTMKVGNVTVDIRGGSVKAYRGTSNGASDAIKQYYANLHVKLSGGVVKGSFIGTGEYVKLNGTVTNTISGGEIRCKPAANSDGVYLSVGRYSTIESATNIMTGGAIHTLTAASVHCGIYFGGANGSVINGNLTNRISGGAVAVFKDETSPSSQDIGLGGWGTVKGTLRNEVSGGVFDTRSMNAGGFFIGGGVLSARMYKIENVFGIKDSYVGPRFLGNGNMHFGGIGYIGTSGKTDEVVVSNTIYSGTYCAKTSLGGGNSNRAVYGSVESTIYDGKFEADIFGTGAAPVNGSAKTTVYGGIFKSVYGSGTGAVGKGVALNIYGMQDYTNLTVSSTNNNLVNSGSWGVFGGSSSGTITAGTGNAVTLTLCPEKNEDIVCGMNIFGGSNTGAITGDVKLLIKGGTLSGSIYNGSKSGTVSGESTVQISAGSFPNGITVVGTTIAQALAPRRYLKDTATGKEIALANGATSVANALTVEMNGEEQPGDVDGSGTLTDSDAIYLLYSVFNETSYPRNCECDFDKDGRVSDRDAIYLLYHIFMPDSYPIE